MAANQPAISMDAYLYDVAADGTATLMSAAPLALTGLKAGTTRKVTMLFQPIAWTIATGHHVALVIDSADHRWETGYTGHPIVVLSSTADAPAKLTLPTP